MRFEHRILGLAVCSLLMACNGTPTSLAPLAGRALYGERWRLSLARGVNIDDDTIRRWMTGRTELPARHGVFADALALMRQREKEIGDAADELERWIKMSGPSPSAFRT